MLIIALVGEIASGKSTFSDYVRSGYGIETVSVRDSYRTPGTKLDRLTITKRLDEEVENFRTEGKGFSGSRTDLGKQIVKSALDGRINVGNVEVMVVSDIVRLIELDYLEHLENVQLHIVEIEPLEVGTRSARHSGGEFPLDGDFLSREQFKDCDEFESGNSVSDKDDWRADLESVGRRANERISNDGEMEDFHRKIDQLLDRLGVQCDEPDQPGGRRAYVTNSDHRPNSVPRVRVLQRRYLASRFLEAFYSLKQAKEARLHDHASDTEREDEREVTRKMNASLEGLGIVGEGSEQELRRVLSPLIGPRHAVGEINNQFMYRLVKVFLEEEAAEALRRFKAIPYSTTQEEIIVGCLSDSAFLACHKALHEFLNDCQAEIHNYATSSFRTSRSFCDQRQKDGVSGVPRGLAVMRDGGIELWLREESDQILHDARKSAAEGPIPVIELIKNQRIIKLAQLDKSKVSHAIHDAMDHVWFFDLLERKGLLNSHQDLFADLGAPQRHDLFQRSGECVASISFGVRLFATALTGFSSLHSIREIERDFDMSVSKHGQLENRHLRAFERIKELANHPNSFESQSLAFVWSNYLVELNEQRRKDGEILRRSADGEWTPLDPRSLDYMAFFIDAHAELHDPKNKHRDSLLRVHVLLEEFFSDPGSLKDGYMVLKWRDLFSRSGEDLLGTTLPPRRIEWMTKHYGFTALRDSAV